MKNILSFLFCLFTLVLSAQEASLQEDVRQLVKLTYDISSKHQHKYLLLSGIPENRREAFKQEYETAVNNYIDTCSKFYMTAYTHEEIREMIKFYQTPAGIKIAKDSRKLLEGEFPKGKEWDMQLYELKDKAKE